jgi:hypothetical protein
MLDPDTLLIIAQQSNFIDIVYLCSTNKSLNRKNKKKTVLNQLSDIYGLPYTNELYDLIRYKTYSTYELLNIAIYQDDVRLFILFHESYYCLDSNIIRYKSMKILQYTIANKLFNIDMLYPFVIEDNNVIVKKVLTLIKNYGYNINQSDLYGRCSTVQMFSTINNHYQIEGCNVHIGSLMDSKHFELINLMIDNGAKIKLEQKNTIVDHFFVNKFTKVFNNNLSKLIENLGYDNNHEVWTIFLIELAKHGESSSVPLIKMIAPRVTTRISDPHGHLIYFLKYHNMGDTLLLLINNGVITEKPKSTNCPKIKLKK